MINIPKGWDWWTGLGVDEAEDTFGGASVFQLKSRRNPRQTPRRPKQPRIPPVKKGRRKWGERKFSDRRRSYLKSLVPKKKKQKREPEVPAVVEKQQEDTTPVYSPLSDFDNPGNYLSMTTLLNFQTPEMLLVTSSFDKNADVRGKVQEVVSWIYRNIKYDVSVNPNGVRYVGYDQPATATDILIKGAGVCSDMAVLAATMLRGMGIPTRMVEAAKFARDDDGVILFHDVSRATGHAFIEFWDGIGWTPADPTVGALWNRNDIYNAIGQGWDWTSVANSDGQDIFKGSLEESQLEGRWSKKAYAAAKRSGFLKTRF